MVDVDKLRGKIVEKRMTIEELSEQIGMDKSTLYRRISGGGSSFTIKEIEQISHALCLAAKEVNEIFFAHYVA